VQLEVLNTLASNDPMALRRCIHLKEWFDYRGHVCMVFEKLGPSLYDFLRRNDYQPFPLAVVQVRGALVGVRGNCTA
jgi:dual-specificity kinase